MPQLLPQAAEQHEKTVKTKARHPLPNHANFFIFFFCNRGSRPRIEDGARTLHFQFFSDLGQIGRTIQVPLKY